MSKCDRCSAGSVIFLRYSGQHLCGDHFLDLLLRRMKKELRAQGFRSRPVTVGLAVSGGKDSVLMAHLFADIAGRMRGVRSVMLTVDEGIAGYRPSSMEIAKDAASVLGMDHRTLSFREMVGEELDDLVKRPGASPCGVCGVLRRKALNAMAGEEGCSYLLTGHNLDDMAQTIMMNILSADLDRMGRLGPHRRRIRGLVPRMLPLRTTPETETHLAAYLKGLPIHDRECPYAVTARRGRIREIVLSMEEMQPGSRHSLLCFQDRVAGIIPAGDPSTRDCVLCGGTIVGDGDSEVCKSCDIIGSLLEGGSR